MHCIHQTYRVITCPTLKKVGIKLGIVPCIANHTIEEYRKVKSFVRCTDVQTTNKSRLVTPLPIHISSIDNVITVKVFVANTPYAGSTNLYIIFA